MRILVGAVAVALLAGCSSNAITVQQAKQASKDQLYAFQARPAGAYGAITVLRDGGINVSAHQPQRSSRRCTGRRDRVPPVVAKVRCVIQIDAFHHQGLCTSSQLRRRMLLPQHSEVRRKLPIRYKVDAQTI